MPSFKPKTVKKIQVNKKNTITLDGKHKEHINDFIKDEIDKIPKLKKERSSLKEKVQKHETSESNSDKITIEELMDIQDRIVEINNEIKQIKSKKSRLLFR